MKGKKSSAYLSLAEKGMSSTQIAKELIAEHTPTITQMRYPERKMAKEHPAWSNTRCEENPE